jgi:hypothetical protein
MDNNFLVGGNTNNKMNFTSNSLLGLNLGSQISDQLSVASQIIMAGDAAQSTNFNTFAQWAYLNYRPTDTISLKIGRQLWPVLISSEYQRVHYLLPQSDIPSTVYQLAPFVSFDGISANKVFNTGIGALTIGAYAGNPKLNTSPPAALDLDFQTLKGARITLDGSGWRLHATYNQMFSKASITLPTVTGGIIVTGTTETAQTRSEAMSFGYRYDKHNFVSWGEVMHLKAKDMGTFTNPFISSRGKRLFEKSYGGYVLAGYRLGKFLPSVTLAQGTTYLGLPTSTTTNAKYEGKTTSYIAGLAYQMHDQAILRAEYQRTHVPSIGGGWYDVVQSTKSTRKFGEAVKAGVDFIF